MHKQLAVKLVSKSWCDAVALPHYLTVLPTPANTCSLKIKVPPQKECMLPGDTVVCTSDSWAFYFYFRSQDVVLM